MSVPAPPKIVSLPAPPRMVSAAEPPNSRSLPALPSIFTGLLMPAAVIESSPAATCYRDGSNIISGECLRCVEKVAGHENHAIAGLAHDNGIVGIVAANYQFAGIERGSPRRYG